MNWGSKRIRSVVSLKKQLDSRVVVDRTVAVISTPSKHEKILSESWQQCLTLFPYFWRTAVTRALHVQLIDTEFCFRAQVCPTGACLWHCGLVLPVRNFTNLLTPSELKALSRGLLAGVFEYSNRVLRPLLGPGREPISRLLHTSNMTWVHTAW